MCVKELWVNIHYSLFSGISSVKFPCELVLSLSRETRMLGGVGRGS
jgi:hypothetical protein